ncbi:MAG: hypothetical protein AAF732_08375 [Pseudomonadota bacterium]
MQTHPMRIARFSDFGFDVVPIGLSQELEGEPAIAFTIAMSDTALRKAWGLLKLRQVPGVDYAISVHRATA